MIKTAEILIGTKEEIADYIDELVKPTRDPAFKYSTTSNTNVLYTKEGFISQIDEILKKDSLGFGIVFYLIRNVSLEESDVEISLELMSKYVRIVEDKK